MSDVFQYLGEIMLGDNAAGGAYQGFEVRSFTA